MISSRSVEDTILEEMYSESISAITPLPSLPGHLQSFNLWFRKRSKVSTPHENAKKYDERAVPRQFYFSLRCGP